MYVTTGDNLEEAYGILDIIEEKMREDHDIAREGDCAFDYFPNDDEIKYIADKIDTDKDFFYYALALSNSDRAPKTEEEKRSRKKLDELIKSVIKVTD